MTSQIIERMQDVLEQNSWTGVTAPVRVFAGIAGQQPRYPVVCVYATRAQSIDRGAAAEQRFTWTALLRLDPRSPEEAIHAQALAYKDQMVALVDEEENPAWQVPGAITTYVNGWDLKFIDPGNNLDLLQMIEVEIVVITSMP